MLTTYRLSVECPRQGVVVRLGVYLVLVFACGFDSAMAQNWESSIRQTLQLPESPPMLAPQVHGHFEPESGIVAERISFGTLYGMRVPAILYRPKQLEARAPALVVVNGHGGDKYSWYAYYTGILYARAGAVVLTYDPLGEGERNPDHKSGSRAHDNLEPKSRELGCIMAGQMVVDLRQAIRYLRTRPEVDPLRIGAVGYSLGTVVIGFTGALEEHLAAAVLAGGGNWDGPGGYWDHGKPLCCGYPFQSLRSLGDLPAILYALRARHGATLVYNGLDDEIVNMTAQGRIVLENIQLRTAKLLGDTKQPFDLGFDEGASHRPFFVSRPVAVWLERHLDFPKWTAEDIEKMPTTPIDRWAKENSVPIDAFYATDKREAGTVALGKGIPGLNCEQLSVFPRSEWEVRKPRFTIDVWHNRVKECMRLAGKPKIALVQGGHAHATIVIGHKASASECEAASELRRCINKSTGIDLPIAHEATGTRILVGEGLQSQALLARVRSLEREGILIETTPEGDVAVVGNGGQGTFYAACAFLEKFVGVRWCWPGELGEIVPRCEKIVVPAPTWHVEEPAFLWRDLGPFGPLWGGKGWDKWEAERQLGYTAEHQAAERLWERRNRFGGLKIYGGHAFAQILPPKTYGETHPEYFALVKGKRDASWKDFDGKHDHQPCTSNPEVIRISIALYSPLLHRASGVRRLLHRAE